MLKSLQVENLALVEKVRLDFGAGLNVITGETGAGKSLLAGALNLALGERADRGMLRAGAAQCVVEACFQLPPRAGAAVDALLAERGLPLCADGELILRRVITPGGGRQFVNDSAVTLQFMKCAGDLLADMHGPHAHQSLLDPAAQLDLLDAYGELSARREEYALPYREYQELLRARQTLEQAPARAAAEDWLEHQVNELESARLSVDEEEELLREQRLLANSQRIMELAAAAETQLMEGDFSAFNALTAVRRTLDALAGLADVPEAWRTELDAAMTRVRELSREISALLQRAESDPARLANLEQRLAVYQKLKHKYGGSVNAALERLEAARAELEVLRHREARLAEIDKHLTAALSRLEAAGVRLRQARHKCGRRLARAIQGELRKLDMAAAVFDARWETVPPGPSGMDALEFAFSANTGEPLRDLRTVASSGEISRVMLAVKSVLAAHDAVPVLVFDEIDVNLGGRAAGVVGQKLRQLARGRQVLCITHLPQVAACGDRHFAVSKTERRGRTVTQAALLEDIARQRELSRMLGRETAATRAHAAELLKTSSVPRQ